jgi:hypothetical protein
LGPSETVDLASSDCVMVRRVVNVAIVEMMDAWVVMGVEMNSKKKLI